MDVGVGKEAWLVGGAGVSLAILHLLSILDYLSSWR